jgi:hypothetical protein
MKAGLFCGTVTVLVAGPIALNNITWKFYFVLIIPPAIEFICIFLFFPETKVRDRKVQRLSILTISSNDHSKILQRYSATK